MPTRFTLRQLEYFVAVGETGSVSQAAEKMHVSPPSVSASIQQLESEFGIQFFVRKHAQGLSLTSGGRQFLSRARELLVSAEGLSSFASDISSKVGGPLHVGCLTTIAPVILPEVRLQFQQKFCDVEVRQLEADQAQLLDRLQSAELDICLSYDLGIPSNLQFIPLVELPTYVMLSPSHRLAGDGGISPEQLIDEPMVLLDLPISNDYFLSAFRSAGLKPNIAERSRDLALVRSMVANGYGYSLANIRTRGDLSPDGKPLKYVPLLGGLRSLRLGLVFGREGKRRQVVHAFVDHCRELINSSSVPGMTMD